MENISVDIRQIINDYTGVVVPEHGGNFECPLHNDTSKNSMKFYPESNTVHCFGACSSSYNSITLVAAIKGSSNHQAYEELQQKYGLAPQTAEDEERIYKIRLLEKLIDEAKVNLDDIRKEALYKRGLTDETINEYRIGYMPEDILNSCTLSEEDLKEIGIISSIGYDKIASNFTDKILIPLYNSSFELVTIAAWNYKNIDNEPKYAYPKGLSKPVAGDMENGAYLVEGVFDLLVMQQLKIKTFSFLGLKPTKEQMKGIRKVKDIKILLDGDEAGMKLADDLAKELYPNAKVIKLPCSHDPNSYFLELGEEKFNCYLEEKDNNAKDFLDEKIEELIQFSNKREAARFLSNDIVPLIVKLDKSEQEAIISEIASHKKTLGITKATIRDKVKEINKESGDGFDSDTNIATMLYEKVKESIELYKDNLGVVYCRAQVEDHLETYPIKGDVFKRYIQRVAIKEFGKIVSMDTINSAKSMIEAEGYFEGETVKLENRVASDEKAFYYDLSDEGHRIIEITPDRWSILNHPKAIFKTEVHQVSQVEPDPNGDIKEILKLFPRLTFNQKLLYLVFLVYSLIPGVPKIIMYVQGEKGSGKSDFTKVTRQLIDSSAIDSLKEPRIEDRVVQQMQHHYVALFDNVNVMHDWFVRLCCTAVTGESDEKRELFSDDGTVIFSYMRVIIINAINRLGINFPDFQERLQMFKIPRIPEEERMEREEFWNVFNKVKPRVLGGMFTTLSKAIAIKPTIKLDKKPRMADYAVWGCAIAIALGYSKEEFLNAYYENMEEANAEMIENHPIANAIYEFMKEKNYWKGKASNLLEELDEIAVDLHVDTKQKIWPRSPSALSMRLNEITSNLADIGIKLTRGQDTGSNASRYIEFSRIRKIEEKNDEITKAQYSDLKEGSV